MRLAARVVDAEKSYDTTATEVKFDRAVYTDYPPSWEDGPAASWEALVQKDWAEVELEKVMDHPILSGNTNHKYVVRYALTMLNRGSF